MGMIVGGIGASQTFSSASGGKVYPFNNITTAPQVVAPANPSRQKITFHNPGPEDIVVGPSLAQGTGSSIALVLTTAAYGGGFRIFANGGTLEITGECAGAWQALTLANVGILTVMDSNV